MIRFPNYTPGTKTLTFCDVTRPYEGRLATNNPLVGIDNFSWTAVHESQHYKDWLDFWGADQNFWSSKKGLTGPDDDFDGDRLPNKIEDVNLNGIYDAGDLYDWRAETTAGNQSGRIDFEEWDYQRHKNAKGDHAKDWASPGMQHGKNDDASD